MNAPFKQADRLGRLTTVLGPDALALLRFDGSDYMNDLFEYRVEALAPRNQATGRGAWAVAVAAKRSAQRRQARIWSVRPGIKRR